MEQEPVTCLTRPIRPDEEARRDVLMAEHHYLGFRSRVGASIKYVALLQGEWVALLGWATADFQCGPLDRWIGWSSELHMRRLRFIANTVS